jgi:hypothetical protein
LPSYEVNIKLSTLEKVFSLRLKPSGGKQSPSAFHSVLSKLYKEPYIGASYQVSVHLATRFQRRRLYRNQPIRNKTCLWRPRLLTNWAELSNLYRGPSIYASYQVSVHLVQRFQRRFFRNQPIRNKNCAK